MVENPASWGPVEKAIADALRKAQEGHAAGRIGWSTPKQIAEALRAQGLIKEPSDQPKDRK